MSQVIRYAAGVLAGLLAAGLGSACSKASEDEAPPSGERTAERPPETPKDAPAGPFAGFDFDAAQARWQGAWVLGGVQEVAWMIDGTTLLEFDGETERSYGFAIYSPCQVTFTDAEAGETTYKTFTFVGDTLHAGLGAAGTVVGETIMACIGGETYVQTRDECGAWSEMFDNWKREPAECAVTGEGEARVFVAAGHELPFVSETALANLQMQGNAAVKHGDYAAAKAALTHAKPD